jgi:hypothetical protein
MYRIVAGLATGSLVAMHLCRRTSTCTPSRLGPATLHSRRSCKVAH